MSMEEEKKGSDHLLPDEIKYAVVFHKKQGDLSNKGIKRQIFKDFGRSIGNSTVETTWENYQKTGTISNQWSTEGRPKVMSLEAQDLLIETARENRLSSAKELKSELNLDASRQTINRELLIRGYNSYRAPVKPLLTDDHIRQRILFAQAHHSWGENAWHRVIFSDESSFQCVRPEGRIFVRRLPEEALELDTTQYSVAKSDSILVWGAISIDGVGPLVRVRGTIKAPDYLKLFRHRLRWYFPDLYGGDQIFQDDNAGPHNAGLVTDWFNKYDIERIEWPARSPDLNIIENIWGKIKYEMRGKIFDSTDDLWEEVNHQWTQIPNEFIHRLYASMPTRINAVIEAQGGITKY